MTTEYSIRTLHEYVLDIHDAIAVRLSQLFVSRSKQHGWSIYAGHQNNAGDRHMAAFGFGFLGGIAGVAVVFIVSLVVEWWESR